MRKVLMFFWTVRMTVRRLRRSQQSRQRVLDVLAKNALKFTGQLWIAADLHVVQTSAAIVIFFTSPDGQPSESVTFMKSDPLFNQIRLKMTLAEWRFRRLAA